MTFWQAILLGLVQGLTEFLPVSSSGHLFLLENYFKTSSGSLTFEIALHLATLLAIIIFFWSAIKNISKKTVLLIALATLPLVPAVFFINDFLEKVSQSITWIAFFLLISALLNFLSYSILNKKDLKPSAEKLENISFLASLKIGLLQVLAVFPGVSRSGITLFGSLSSKIQANTAFQFSFLLSIPAILGALFFDLLESNAKNLQTINWSITLPAMLVAFVSGLFSLKLLKGFLNSNRFLFFALYCLFLSVSLFIFN
jgi:undecaprenyl-diphosphatase